MIKKVPMRQCLGCREMRPKRELIRVVRSPEGEVSLDLNGHSPGRGAYICPRSECFAKAKKSKAFERAFSAPVPDEVYASFAEELGENMSEALRMLSISRKAGKIEIGEESVLSCVESRKARLVLLASDAASNTAKRITSALSQTQIAYAVSPFTKEELGGALGKGICAVCAVCDLGLAAAVARSLERDDAEKYAQCAQQLRQTSERIEQRKQKKPGKKSGKKEN
ncbi:MAG: DUF448 domain-containing protein [Oscillospiraceae bacterium]|nr:DUF448 domain-containing protein [Oscillospiraceae bacterium]